MLDYNFYHPHLPLPWAMGADGACCSLDVVYSKGSLLGNVALQHQLVPLTRYIIFTFPEVIPAV